VDAGEVVVHEVQRHGVHQVLDLLGEGIGQPRESPHPHSHREVLPLYVAGRNVLRVGLSRNNAALSPDAVGTTVAPGALRLRAIYLVEYGVVDVSAEGFLDGVDVRPITVRRQLDAVGKPVGQVRDKSACVCACAPSYQPTRDNLGVGAEGSPCPHVPIAELALVLLRDILVFGVAERPYLIALNPLAGQVAKVLVLIPLTGFA